MKKKLIKELILSDEPIFNKQKISKSKFIKNQNNKSLDTEDFNYKYSNDNLYYKSEIALWKAVILQAMLDLQTNSKKKIANTYRVKALMWFNLKNEDFLTVCNYAGLDPLYVYQKSQIVKKNNKFFN